jgi:hypothetical protein
MANRLFNYLLVIILVLISFVIGFNTGKIGDSKQVNANPTWWMSESVDDAVSYFYGTASAVSEDIALYRAEVRAIGAVIDSINSQLGSDEETTSYSQKIIVSKMRRVKSLLIELPAKGIYKAYVQVEIPVEVLEKLTDKGVEENY